MKKLKTLENIKLDTQKQMKQNKSFKVNAFSNIIIGIHKLLYNFKQTKMLSEANIRNII